MNKAKITVRLAGLTHDRRADRCVKLLSILLLSVMAAWFLNVHVGEESRQWEYVSENLIYGRMIGVREEGFSYQNFLLGRYSDNDVEQYVSGETPARDGYSMAYTAQSGLQGTVFALADRLLHGLGLSYSAIQKLLWIGNSGLFIFCMLLLCKWIMEIFGWGGCAGFLSSIFLSSWMQKSIPNLYWVTWTMLLPTVITAWWTRYWPCDRKKAFRWGLLLFLAILARCMCGFEFISTVMLCCEMPVLYRLLAETDPGRRRQWVWLGFWVGVTALAAFAVAILIWILQILWFFGGDVAQTKELIIFRLGYRTGAFPDQVDVDGIFRESLDASRLGVVRGYICSSEGFWGPLTVKSLLFLGVVLIVFRTWLEKSSVRHAVVQILFLAACMLPAISWYFLAVGHSYICRGLCLVCWLFPFVPVAAASISQNSIGIIRLLEKRKDELR